MMSNKSNKELILGLKHGDKTAFKELFENYHHKIFNFCKSILGLHSQAEEITQEVFIAVWHNRQKLDENGSFSSYIFAITRNQINNYISKTLYQQRFIEYITNQGEKSQIFTENQVLFNELKSILNKIIEKLPPKRKRIFLLSREEGLTYRQISEKLNISENTVDTQMRKALEFIKESIPREYQ